MPESLRRPLGTEITNEELEKQIISLQRESYATRQEAEIRWLVANAMLEGYHYYNVDWRNRQVVGDPSNPKGTVRVKIPDINTKYRREKGRMLSYLRPFTTKPITMGKPDVWRLNRFGQGAISYLWETANFTQTFTTLIGDILTGGTAGLMPYWDVNAYGPEGSGEVRFLAIPAWQLYPFPSNAVEDDQLEGVIWSRVVGEEWIKRNIPEAIDEPQTNVTTPYHMSYGSYSSGNISTPYAFKGYEVRYAFYKPSRRFPNGQQIIMVGSKIYRRTDLEFWLGDQRVLPISFARSTKLGTSWWGDNWAYNIGMINKEINRLASLMVRRAILKAHPGWLMYPLGAINPEDLKDQLGGIVPFTPNSLQPEISKPYWLTAPPSTADTDVVINRMSTYADDYASQHGPSKGITSGRVESASAIGSLQDADQVPIEEMVRSVDECCKRAFGIALEIARSRWSKTRVASISGPIGGMPVSVQIDPSSIPALTDIKIVSSLENPMSRQDMMQLLMQLATPSARGAQPLLDPEDFRRGMVAMGIMIPGIDLLSPDEEQAWVENLLIYGDGTQPGQAPEPDSQLEASDIHLRVHKKFASRPEVRFAAPVIQAAFRDHIAKTANALNPMQLPGGDYDTTTMSDERALEEQVLGSQMGARMRSDISGPQNLDESAMLMQLMSQAGVA
jgi:hypothetical protein